MKIYQNIGIKGLNYIPGAETSQFYNENRWNNFIKPLLPENAKDMTFVEIGSNCGLFLKLAKEYGFRDVMGIEKSVTHHNLAEKFRDDNNLDYKLINASIDEYFDVDKIPVSDYILLSLVHYHMRISDFLLFLDKLFYKTRNIIVVSSPTWKRYWRADGSIESVRDYFKHWKEVKHIEPITVNEDSLPRELFSFLYSSDLKRVNIDDLYAIDKKSEIYLTSDDRYMNMARKIVASDDVKPEDTVFYKQLIDKGYGKKFVEGGVQKVIDNFYDIKRNGIRNPIVIFPNNQIADGGHRVVMSKALGYNSIIARVVK